MAGIVTSDRVDSTFELDSLSLDQWHALVETHPDSTPFHHRNWIEIIQDQYQFPLHIPAIRCEGKVAAALPFLETRTVLGRRKRIALPFTDSIGPLATDEASEQALIDWLCFDSTGGGRSTIIRTHRRYRGVASTSPWVRHTLDTSSSLDEVESRFSGMLRRNIRRAEKRGLRFQRRTDEAAIDEFYRLHLITRRKLGVPIQPKRFITRVGRRMIAEGLGFVGLVTKDNAVIAAGVFLVYQQTMVYKYVASDPSALEHRPNEWLAYHAIREAVESGITVFDFGSSNRHQEGLRRFKSKWGAVESDLFEYSLATPSESSAHESSALKLLGTVIRRSPPFVCRGLGEMFYRYSP